MSGRLSCAACRPEIPRARGREGLLRPPGGQTSADSWLQLGPGAGRPTIPPARPAPPRQPRHRTALARPPVNANNARRYMAVPYEYVVGGRINTRYRCVRIGGRRRSMLSSLHEAWLEFQHDSATVEMSLEGVDETRKHGKVRRWVPQQRFSYNTPKPSNKPATAPHTTSVGCRVAALSRRLQVICLHRASSTATSAFPCMPRLCYTWSPRAARGARFKQRHPRRPPKPVGWLGGSRPAGGGGATVAGLSVVRPASGGRPGGGGSCAELQHTLRPYHSTGNHRQAWAAAGGSNETRPAGGGQSTAGVEREGARGRRRRERREKDANGRAGAAGATSPARRVQVSHEGGRRRPTDRRRRVQRCSVSNAVRPVCVPWRPASVSGPAPPPPPALGRGNGRYTAPTEGAGAREPTADQRSSRQTRGEQRPNWAGPATGKVGNHAQTAER